MSVPSWIGFKAAMSDCMSYVMNVNVVKQRFYFVSIDKQQSRYFMSFNSLDLGFHSTGQMFPIITL